MSNPAGIPVTENLVFALIPAYRSLLDWSGAGRDPTFTGAAGSNWIRQNGVWQFRAQGTGRLVVPNDVTLEAVTDFTLCCAGSWLAPPAGRVFSKRDAGGTHLDIYLDSITSIVIYNGAITRSATIGSWAGVRNFAVAQASGAIGDLYANGAWKSVFSGAVTITANDADISILNLYTGATPQLNSFHALLLYNRVLTADEISDTAVFTDSLTSPTISPNRRYFDRGSWVPNGSQPSYGVSGSDLVVDGDMEALGAELLVDGDMEAVGTGAYTPTFSAILSKETGTRIGGSGNQVLQIEINTAQTKAVASQSIQTIGKTYRATGWMRGDGGTGTPRVTDGGFLVVVGTSSTTWQAFDEVYVAQGIDIRLRASGVAGDSVQFDDVTVKECVTTAWTPIASAILTKEAGAPGGTGSLVLRVTHDGVANPSAAQAILTVGQRFRVTGWARSDGTAVPRVLSGAAGIDWVGVASTAWQYFDVTGVVASIGMYYRTTTAIAGWAEFDNVTVEQTNNLLSDGDMEDGTTGEWSDANGGVSSKETGAPHEGTQVIRVTGPSGGYTYQDALIVGVKYRVTGWARGSGVLGQPTFFPGAQLWAGTTSNTWQNFDVTFVATSTRCGLRMLGGAGAEWAEWDQVLVREIFETVGAWSLGNIVNRTCVDVS